MKIALFLLLIPAAVALAQVPAPKTHGPAWKPDQPLLLPLERETAVRGIWRAGFGLWRPEGEPEKSAAARIPVELSAQPGLSAWRLESTSGVSEPLLLYLEDLPVVEAAPENFSSEKAQELSVPASLDSFCPPLKSRFYRFPARAGETLGLEVVADRLGSRLDALLRLLDAEGRELAASDDGVGCAGRDGRLSHTFARDGQYQLEVRDLNHEGGDSHFFHLRVGHFAVTHGAQPVCVKIAGDSPAARESLFGWSRAAPGGAPLLVRPREPHRETESDAPVEISEFPAGYSGTLEKPGDQDGFAIKTDPGRKLRLRTYARSIGSPAHLRLEALAANGKALPGSPAPGDLEPAFSLTAPENGICRIKIRDLLHGGSPAHFYHVDIEDDPGFSLQIDRDTWNGAAGETVEITLTCQRTHHQGPIELRLEPAPPGLKLAETVLPATDKKKKKDDKTGLEMKLKIEIDREIAPGTIFHFNLAGQARKEEADGGVFGAAVPASTRPALMKRWPEIKALPGELDGWIAFGVNAPPKPPKEKDEDKKEKPQDP